MDHGGWGSFLRHPVNNEYFFTIQHLNNIATYRPNLHGKLTPVSGALLNRFKWIPSTGTVHRRDTGAANP